ncbi:MAG: hypothetical protein GY915_09420 [bacterium]|nr:hypothetical protein [bacterium]
MLDHVAQFYLTIDNHVLNWDIPEETWEKITSKIPEDWKGPIPSKEKDGEGLKWYDGKGNQIRVMKGKPHSQFPAQKKDYVKVSFGGKVVLKDGSATSDPVNGTSPADLEDAHIPLSEDEAWEDWEVPDAPNK